MEIQWSHARHSVTSQCTISDVTIFLLYPSVNCQVLFWIHTVPFTPLHAIKWHLYQNLQIFLSVSSVANLTVDYSVNA